MFPLFALLALAPLPGRIDVTCVDSEAIGYATFQSHNQKVVNNSHGIFMTHLRTRNEAYTAQTWRLSHSTDGGRTFQVLYEATHATNPPVLETDSKGNVYLIRTDFTDGSATLYRFLSSKQYRDPETTRIPNGAAGKYAACLDEPRRLLYYLAHNGIFHTVGLDGKLIASMPLIKDGPDAGLQYPLLYLEKGGRLHAAWTTQRHGVYLYWDIHHMVSDDGGRSWRTMEGKPITPPVVADQHGPATRITLDDEFEAHTWLSSFVAFGGKAHFLYLAQTSPPRQHYVRYDLATGLREADVQPVFRGETLSLQGLDGFFAVGRRGELYCVGSAGGYLGCLVSRDGGKSWHDFARSEQPFHLYAIGGCRAVAPDGEVIGSFTDQSGNNLATDRTSKVYFFRITEHK